MPFPEYVFHKIVFIALALVLAAGPADASPDEDFLAARSAYAKGRIDQFDRLAARVPEAHPLAPYLLFWRLKSRNATPAEWAAFAAQHSDSPLSQRAWLDVARQYGRGEDWANFRTALARAGRTDPELDCYQLRARLTEGDAGAEAAGVELFRVSQDLPSGCDPLFAALAGRGALTEAVRLARLRLALEAGNLRLARELLGSLPAADRSEALLAQAQRGPEKVVETAPAGAAELEVVLYGLAQVARKDPAQAAARWEKVQDGLPEPVRQHGWGVVAMAAARGQMPEAVDWYLRARDQLSDSQKLWRVRVMLRAGRWLDVFQGIVSLPAKTQEEAVWRYWKARALKALNAASQANPLFAALSREIHYYALLADEELPVRLENRDEEYRPSAEDVAASERRPALARALLLRKLDLRVDAVAEWDWALREMDDRQILAAAELARREQWYDRAILTAEKTRDLHNFDLRYLTPYRDLAEAQARQNGLDPAWVYGLMRQESRFVDYARSRVGAQGLMQIMPATSRWIARQLGLGRKAQASMNDPAENIRFGTYYLRHVQDSLQGSAVLASAGYNAGPGRARKWQALVPLEGAIYVESIPFAETREYVKKVLANAVYYSQRLGLPGRSLKARLGTIPARGVATGSLPEDPDEP
jgi:soluble lytic murein transglycosylase